MVITGTRKGIGRFLATHYLGLGWTVVGCSRQASDLTHEHYTHHTLDVADEPAVRRMVFETGKRCGGIDALVNNAGVASMNHALLTPYAAAQSIIATNFLGTFLFCREVAKVMQRRRQGRIVNFTTIARPLNLEGESVYAASKAAVETLTRVLCRELGAWDITVNAVGPTPIDTDLIRSVPSEKIDRLVQAQAIRRRGAVEDVAHVIDFFLDPRSAFVTGQVIYLGGIT